MNGLRTNRIKVFLFIFLFLHAVSGLQSQELFRVVFYNVENLFDTKDNPDTHDDDLTPQGQLRWTNYRYWKKLNDISRVIADVGGKYPPALVGLCEIENDSVLFDLTKRAPLRKHKYEYIISHSADFRGSNVALLYQRDQIKIVGTREYTPILEINSSRTTRNILHVAGKVVNGDTLDIFVCHFPSRIEGLKKTRPYRIKCAELLKEKTDSISRIRKKANILIMGDFNDYPDDASMHKTLDARSLKSFISSKSLYNMFYHQIHEKEAGAHKYRGKWSFLDQFIVNGNLLNSSNKVLIKNKTAYIYSADYLLEEDKKYGGQKPLRTYVGFKYLGGTSDHLPIYMDLIIK